MSKIALYFVLLFPFISTNIGGQNMISEEDIRYFHEIFEGEFNNYQQVHQEREDQIDESMRHEHIHSIFKRIQLPWLGKHVYFVKQYLNNDPSKIYRQRIYHFHTNRQEEAIQLDIYSFSDPTVEERYRNADHSPEMLHSLDSSQLVARPGCEVFWKRNEDAFIGYMKDRACNFMSRRSGKRIYITDSLYLDKEQIHIKDEAEDEEGNYIFGHKGGIPHILRKCTYYKGWAALPSPNDSTEMEAIRNIKLHNQGGAQEILRSDGSSSGYSIRLAELVYNHKIPVLQLAIFKDDQSSPHLYTWASPGSARIGLNHKTFFQVGLTRIMQPFGK